MPCFCKINADFDAEIYKSGTKKLHTIRIGRKYCMQFLRTESEFGKHENIVRK